jgi:hypothetical protein
MGIFWGFALIWIGISYFGASLGWWDYAKASEIWLYWPLALIFGGFSAILRGKKFGWLFLGGLFIASSFLIYDLTFASQPLLFNKSWQQKYGREVSVTEKEINVEKDQAAEGISYKFKLGAINADISGVTEKALQGKLTSSFMGLDQKSSLYDKTQIVEVNSESISGPMLWFGRKVQNNLQASFNSELPISLELDCGASDVSLNLSEYILKDLSVSTGASNIYLKIGEKVENGARAEISTGASSVNIEVPKNIGVRIKSNDGMTANQFSGFVKNGDYYENEAYVSAEKKIQIVLKTGVSSVRVSQY